MLDIYQWSVLITAIFWTSFGVFAYVKNHKDFSTKLFALLSVSFAVYSYSWFFLLRSTDFVSAFFYSRVLACAAPFIVIFYLHWALTVVDVNKKRRFVIYLCYLLNLVFFYFILTDPSYIADAKPIMFFPFWPVAGHNYVYFLVFGYGVTILYSVYELVKGYLNSTGDKKHQIIYLMLGSLLGFGGGVTNFPLMYGLSVIQPFGVFAIMASPFIYSYAAVRYKLMDIKVVATQFFAGAINVIFIIRLILSESPQDYFFNGFLLAFVIGFTVLLINGVRKEVRQREALAIANAGQESLIHAMNHQIKGYLGKGRAIFAELLTGDYGSMPETAKPMLEEGLSQSAKGVDYVQGILRGASAANGLLPYDMKSVDLKNLVLDVIAHQKPVAESKGLLFTSNITDDEYNIVGDATQLEEAFRNLIENAIKYNSPSGAVTVTLARDNKEIIFSVKDAGVGVAEDVKSRLFTAGGRSKDSTKYNADSSGFGLAFVKGVIESHKGNVGYKANVGEKGTTFFAKLPIS